MKMNKLLILFFVFMLSIYTASAADSADIVEGSLDLSVQQGTTNSGSFNVNNNGTTNLSYSFTSSTLTKGGDNINLNPISDSGVIINGSSQSVSFSATISDPDQATGVYTGTVNVTKLSDPAVVYDTVTVNVNVTPSFSVSSSVSAITFNDVQRNTTKTGTLTITNDGNGDLTNVVPTSSAAAKYNVVFNNTAGFNLNKLQSIDLGFNFTVPFDESTTNHSIGSILINSNEFNSSSLATISVDVKGGLAIDDFDVRIYYKFGEKDGDTDVIQGVTDGQSLDFDEDVRPGSELRFNINVENTFTSSEDIDIEDVTVTVTIEEIDDGEDVDEEGDEFDLDPGEEERTTVYFDIPLEVEEGEYDVLVEIEGQDSEGTTHSIEWNLELTINKERRIIVINKADLTRSTISCNRDTRLNVKVLNIGTKEEDVKVEIINSDLGVEFVEEGIDLEIEPFEDDDEYEKSLSIPVSSNVAAGTYPIKVNAYIASGALFDSKTVNLVVNECGVGEEDEEVTEEEETTEEEEPISVEQPEVTGEDVEGTSIPVLKESITETKEGSSSPLILSMVIAGLAAIVIGVFVAMKFVPKK